MADLDRPTALLYPWATDATWVASGKTWNGAATKVQPTNTSEGMKPEEGAAANHLNWIFDNLGNWVDYLDKGKPSAAGLFGMASLGSNADYGYGVVPRLGEAFGVRSAAPDTVDTPRTAINWGGTPVAVPGTLTGIPYLANGYNSCVMVQAGTAWSASSTPNFGISTYPLTNITAATGIVWCEGQSKYFACGTGASGTTGVIESSTDGTSWSLEVGTLNNQLLSIATDGSQAVAAIPSPAATIKQIMYTLDGGTTWLTQAIPGTNDPNSITYDARRGLWVIVESGTTSIWTTETLGTTWTNTGTQPETDCDVIRSTDSGLWILSKFGGATVGLYYSLDAGTTWEGFWPATAAPYYEIRDRRLWLRDSATTSYLSDRLW